MEEVRDLSDFSGAWNPRFLRPFNEWEMEQVHNFVGLLNVENNQERIGEKSSLCIYTGGIVYIS